MGLERKLLATPIDRWFVQQADGFDWHETAEGQGSGGVGSNDLSRVESGQSPLRGRNLNGTVTSTMRLASSTP
jgi:hypothetical protein